MVRPVLVVFEVADLGRSVALYRDGFGIDLHVGDHGGDDRWTSGRHGSYSWRDGAYFHFALYEAKTDERSTGAQLGLSVDDIEAGHAQAVAAGAEVIHPPRPEPWGATARYRDPDGNIVSLTQSA